VIIKTVGELREKLSGFPDDMEVVAYWETILRYMEVYTDTDSDGDRFVLIDCECYGEHTTPGVMGCSPGDEEWTAVKV